MTRSDREAPTGPLQSVSGPRGPAPGRPMRTRALPTLLCALTATPAAVAQDLMGAEPFVSGLSQPVGFASPHDGSQRVMVLEQFTGQVRVVEAGVLLETPLIDVGDDVTAIGEQGLLGMAFHPDFSTNGRCFLTYNDTTGALALAELYLAPGSSVADPATVQVLATVPKPFTQHNGGSIHFGLDGMLYWSTGDGGAGYDPEGHAQDLGSLLGKVLRIDVDGAAPYAIPADNPFVGVVGAREEVWAYGLRNPWRTSFDRLTGDLWLGDVGQEMREEIDLAPTGVGGLDFGWVCLEGTLETGFCTPDPSHVPPVHEYDHSGGCAVVGGYVYRGVALPELYGRYVYSDYCTGRTWSFPAEAVGGAGLLEHTAELGGFQGLISALGEDEDGELYIAYYTSGEVVKVVPPVPVVDCDGDGTPDADELAQGTAFDVNGNDTPDDCELLLGATDLVGGQPGTWEFIGAEPGQLVVFLYSIRGIGSGPCYFDGALCLDLQPFLIGGVPGIGLLGLGLADASGLAVHTQLVPAIVWPIAVGFQAVAYDEADSQKSNPIQKLVTSS